MKRRDFFLFCGAMAATWSRAGFAQQPSSFRRIGVLMGFPEGDPQAQRYVRALHEKLQTLGWVENRNLRIDYRWAGGDSEKTRVFARELVGLGPSVIVTSTNQETVRQETAKIPIVFASLGDPVGSGLVQTLARPGGNVTGFPVFVEAMGSKWLELVKEAVAGVERIGFLHHPDVAPHRGLLKAAQSAAPSMNLKLIALPVHNAKDISEAITTFGSEPNGALVTASHAVTFSNRDLIVALALKYRLPTVFGEPLFAESGGFISYGSDQIELFRGAASYVDLILKGANPAELPVQLPIKFNLTINMKTAKQLGVTVPAPLLARADEVIE